MIRILGGSLKGRTIRSPKGKATRPTLGAVRESVFNICQNKVAQARFLDLFAGSGAMGFEAISRGAVFSVFVDRDKNATRALKENAKILQIEELCNILFSDVFFVFPKLKGLFDIVYIDPPYNHKAPFEMPSKILHLLEKHGLIATDGLVFVEIPDIKEKYEYESNYLRLEKTRKFGSSRLLEFQKIG